MNKNKNNREYWKGGVKNNISFLMEPLVYDPIKRPGSLDCIPQATISRKKATKTFSNPKFNINYLKVEVPVDLSFVEGFGDPIIKQKEAIKKFLKMHQLQHQVSLFYI